MMGVPGVVAGNQDAFRQAGALIHLSEMIEDPSPYQNAALWALYNLVVNSTCTAFPSSP